MSTPMDPDRLLRGWAQARVMIGSEYVREMLADRDYQERRAEQAEPSLKEARAMLADLDRRLVERQRERDEARAEVTRLRARVRVEAEDVEDKVTREHVEAWLRTNGWETLTHEDGWLSFVAPSGPHVDVHLRDGWSSAWVINSLARLVRRPGLDILDEMAAMTPVAVPE